MCVDKLNKKLLQFLTVVKLSKNNILTFELKMKIQRICEKNLN